MASEDENQHSLFGSPGPSRSPSPTLVLPGAPDGIAQNVGTIALPGSQHRSELPKDLLAPPLQNPVSCRDIRPSSMANAPSSGVSTPSSRSRASSVVPPATRARTRKRKRKEHQPSPAPSITLPDPSAPLPPNFLRNQVALLGTAGLVAGIKPANLLTASRGSTPTNPIVVEDEGKYKYVKMKPNSSGISTSGGGVRYDEHDTPRLGKRSESVTPSLEIDLALLPAPTNREIVAMLIGQKDIFPVLQGILRLVAGQKEEQLAVANASRTPALSSKRNSKRRSERPTPMPTPTGPKAPPLKRRRLNRVPAGAADWDVPYPFQEGEGPEEYRQTWEKERGKQLIAQLVNLVRTAAQKAATKKYLQQEVRLKTASKTGHIIQSQRSQSAPAALKEAGQPGSIVGDVSAPSTRPEASTPVTPSLDFASPSSELMPETSFDQLISSLLAASRPCGVTNTQGSGACGVGAGALSCPSAAFANNGDDVNDALIDSWMNVFETFPIPPDGFASALDTSFQKQQPSDSASAFGTLNFDLFDTTSSLDFNLDMPLPPSGSINAATTDTGTILFPQLPPENALQEDAEQFMRDLGLEPIPTSHSTQYHTIDDFMNYPTSSTILQPQPRPVAEMDKSTSNDQTSEEAGSAPALSVPYASSVSTIGDADPSTPISPLWESGTPDIVFAQHSQDPSSSQEGCQQHEDNEDSETIRFSAQEKGKWKENEKTVEDRENLGQDMDAETAPPELANTPIQRLMGASPMPSAEAAATTSSLGVSILGSQGHFSLPTVTLCSTPGQRKLNKQEIIQLAQERRRQLVEELERVKMQLWETTIEQSVLVELQKEALP